MVGCHLSLAMLKSKKQFELLLQNAFLHLLEFHYQRFVKQFLRFEEQTPKTWEVQFLNKSTNVCHFQVMVSIPSPLQARFGRARPRKIE